MRFPLYPIVDQAIIDVNLMFGIDIVNRWIPSAEDYECAASFDVKAALEKALEDRRKAGMPDHH